MAAATKDLTRPSQLNNLIIVIKCMGLNSLSLLLYFHPVAAMKMLIKIINLIMDLIVDVKTSIAAIPRCGFCTVILNCVMAVSFCGFLFFCFLMVVVFIGIIFMCSSLGILSLVFKLSQVAFVGSKTGLEWSVVEWLQIIGFINNILNLCDHQQTLLNTVNDIFNIPFTSRDSVTRAIEINDHLSIKQLILSILVQNHGIRGFLYYINLNATEFAALLVDQHLNDRKKLIILTTEKVEMCSKRGSNQVAPFIEQ
jgi:hypothetical protein